MVTLTAFCNTQTAHCQQNKTQDVSKKKNQNQCCPQNTRYTEYNQVHWLWQFIEFLQCFLELRTVHCCSASNSTAVSCYFSIKRPLENPSEREPGCKLLRKLSQEKKIPEDLTAHLYPRYHPDPHRWDRYHLQLEAVRKQVLSKCLSASSTGASLSWILHKKAKFPPIISGS